MGKAGCLEKDVRLFVLEISLEIKNSTFKQLN